MLTFYNFKLINNKIIKVNDYQYLPNREQRGFRSIRSQHQE